MQLTVILVAMVCSMAAWASETSGPYAVGGMGIGKSTGKLSDQRELDRQIGSLAPSQPLTPTYKIIDDPSDLAVAPRKYVGINIELRRVRCFYADVNEYRCFGGMPPVTIFSRGLTSEGGQTDIQQSCDTIKKAEHSRDCVVSLRFRFEASDLDEDVVSFYMKRTVIKTDTAEVNWPTWTRVRRYYRYR